MKALTDEQVADAVTKWRRGFRRRHNIPIETDGGPYTNTDDANVTLWLNQTAWAPHMNELEFLKLKKRVVKIIQKRKAAKAAAARKRNRDKTRQHTLAL